MKKDFKTRIAEIAAKIADNQDEAMKVPQDVAKFSDKLDDLKGVLATFEKGINNADEFANLILSMREKLPNLSDDAAKAGVRLAQQVMSSSKPVSKDAPGAMYDKMPIPDDLKEAFNRINRR